MGSTPPLSPTARMLFAFLLVAAAAAPCAAATFTVDSTVDAPDASPLDGVCATAMGACTLRAAVQTANGLAGADVIVLPAGTYTFAVAGRDEEAAAQGDLDVTDALVINGAGSATTIVDGGGLDRVFDVHATSVELRDVTIRNGATTEMVGGSGGATADPADGGGIRGTDSSILLDHGTVTLCRGLSGGGVSLKGGSLEVHNSTISDNGADAYDGGGGGIDVDATATCVVTDSSIAGNHSSEGGAGVWSYGATTIARCTITDNDSAAYGWGGGVFAAGPTDIDETTISGNRTIYGGGVYGWSGTDLRVTRSLVSANQAQEGGGIVGGLVENSTISGNTATVDGGGAVGGIYRNVTITANVADSDGNGSGDGGGLVGGEIANSIVAGNTDSGGEADDCSGIVTSDGYNLVERAESCFFLGDPTGNVFGLPAHLGALADNGGPTQTHPLLAGSPALDAGNPAPAGSAPAACSDTDQRSAARPYAGACDIGAFEATYTITSCGNGTLDAGEQCDDGNVRDNDCCSSTCQFENPGGLCTDGDICTTDTCDGAGTCNSVGIPGPCKPNHRPNLVINGDFEDNTASAVCSDNLDLSDAAFNAKMADATSFAGPTGQIDIMLGDCSGPPAVSGTTKVGISGDDRFSLALSSPVLAGHVYLLSFYVLAEPDPLRPGPGGVSIGLSSSATDPGDRISAVDLVNYDSWVHDVARVLVSSDASYLTVSKDAFPLEGWSHLDAFSLTETTCGDGVVDPGEDCDDGNTSYYDCCSPTCQFLVGTPCDDGDNCTTDDFCGSSGVCLPGVGVDCNDGNPCTQDSCSNGACVNAGVPVTTCHEGAKGSLSIKAGATDDRNRIDWKWSEGSAFDFSEFGDPSVDARYTLCVYDSSGGNDSLAGRLVVHPSARWLNRPDRSWSYKDTIGAENGVTRMSLRTNGRSEGTLQLDARGGNIPMPAALSPTAFFAKDPSVTVQLFREDDPWASYPPVCWTNTFTSATSNSPTRFQAKLP